jgi:hypothetical protein
MRLEGLGHLKSVDIGNRTRCVPAISIVPQPTPLPRSPSNVCRGMIMSEDMSRTCKISTGSSAESVHKNAVCNMLYVAVD